MPEPPLSWVGKDISDAHDVCRRDHLALSLRTASPREARRRAARIAALFEFGWASYEQAMQDRPELAGANLQQGVREGAHRLLRSHVDMYEKLPNTAMSELMKEHTWSGPEIEHRLACESGGQRVGWGDDNLLASPVPRAARRAR